MSNLHQLIVTKISERKMKHLKGTKIIMFSLVWCGVYVYNKQGLHTNL